MPINKWRDIDDCLPLDVLDTVRVCVQNRVTIPAKHVMRVMKRAVMVAEISSMRQLMARHTWTNTQLQQLAREAIRHQRRGFLAFLVQEHQVHWGQRHDLLRYAVRRRLPARDIGTLLAGNLDPNHQNTQGQWAWQLLLDRPKLDMQYAQTVSQLFVEHQGDLSLRTPDHDTLLHLAVRHQHSRMVQWLLDHGASPDVWNKQNHSPLFLALRPHFNRHPRIIQQLATPESLRALGRVPTSNRCNTINGWMRSQTTVDRSSLNHAIHNCHVAIVRLLLEAGADPNFPAAECDQGTSLHFLVQHTSPAYQRKCAPWLLEFGARTDFRDQHQRPARHYASESVRKLLDVK